MKNIAKALSIFHEEMGTITKDANNPFFKSKYAPLETILPAIKEHLKKAGLVFTQMPNHLMSSADKTYIPSIITKLIHIESGEELSAEVPLVLAKQDPQGVGSAITYMRRYALVSMLGLNCDEDDDGNKASTPSQSVRNAPKYVQNAKDVESILSPRKQAEKDIQDEEDIFGLRNLEDKIKKSTKFNLEEKEQLLFTINEKVETLDPTK